MYVLFFFYKNKRSIINENIKNSNYISIQIKYFNKIIIFRILKKMQYEINLIIKLLWKQFNRYSPKTFWNWHITGRIDRKKADIFCLFWSARVLFNSPPSKSNMAWIL